MADGKGKLPTGWLTSLIVMVMWLATGLPGAPEFVSGFKIQPALDAVCIAAGRIEA